MSFELEFNFVDANNDPRWVGTELLGCHPAVGAIVDVEGEMNRAVGISDEYINDLGDRVVDVLWEPV